MSPRSTPSPGGAASRWLASLTFGVCLLHASDGAAQLRSFKVGAGSQIQFVSDAPLERITGVTSKVSGEISVDPNAPSAAKARISVPVASIKTNNDLRDEHLRSENWLDAARAPNIELVLTQVSGIDKLVPDSAQEATLTGKLTVHGVPQDITTKARVRWSPNAASTNGGGDALRVQASFVVKLGNHKVSIPSIVALKVSPNIQVNVDLRARAAPVPRAPVPSTTATDANPLQDSAAAAKLELPPKPAAPKKETVASASGNEPVVTEVPSKPAANARTIEAVPGTPARPARARPPPPVGQTPTVTSPATGPAGHVQKLSMLMRQARKALAANDLTQAEDLIRKAQSVLAHVKDEHAGQP